MSASQSPGSALLLIFPEPGASAFPSVLWCLTCSNKVKYFSSKLLRPLTNVAYMLPMSFKPLPPNNGSGLSVCVYMDGLANSGSFICAVDGVLAAFGQARLGVKSQRCGQSDPYLCS